MRKPSPGVCGRCGAPAPRPDPPVAEDDADLRRWGRCWRAGHLYEERGGALKLVRVRCRACAEGDDPRLAENEGLGCL